MVNAITQIDIKPPWLTKQGFVAVAAAAIAVAGGLALAIRLRFHNHALQQLTRGLALHQQAADELGGNLLGGAAEEVLGVGGWAGWMGVVPIGVAWVEIGKGIGQGREYAVCAYQFKA